MAADEPQPWKKVSLRSERDYRIFTTRTWDVLDPRTGTPWVRTVIDSADWVNVLAITADQQVVLVRQFRFGTWSNSLEIPGGIVDPGESPETAGLRELEEETGFRAGRVRLQGSCHPNPALQSNRLHSYLAEDCTRVHDGHPEASEDLQVVLVPRTALGGLVRDGQITHALVLAALLYELVGAR